MVVLPFPDIDPVLFQIGPIFGIGPIAIRWYALAYIAGILLGWWYVLQLLRMERLWRRPAHNGLAPATANDIGDLLVWVTLGIVLGGRLGFVLFYGLIYAPEYFIENPLRIFFSWEGGMSFHGGMIGVILAIVLFCRSRQINMVRLGDLIAAATPIGIFFGRLANFVNGELWGKVSNVPWAMVFPDPRAGPDPRHPSQLYEAALEGLLLFIVLRLMITRWHALDRPGLVIAVFMIGYGSGRAFAEIFRDSEAWLFYPNSGFTMGMLLSVPMWAVGLFFLWYALRTRPAASLEAARG